MAILTMARHRFYKNDGSINSGGKVWTYVAGTTTPAETYTSSDASVTNTNPVILDSHGEADIWVSTPMKWNVLESNDTQVTGWPVDNIGAGVINNDANMRWAGTATGTANAIAIAPSPAIAAYAIGQSFIFKAGASPNSAATTISVSGLASIAVQISGSALTGGEILAGKWYSIVLDSLTTCQVEPVASAALAGSTSQTFAVAAAVAAGDAVSRSFGDARYAPYPVYVSSYVPTFTLTHGGTLSKSVVYCKIGNIVTLTLTYSDSVSTTATYGGSSNFSLPFTPAYAATGVGINGTTGASLGSCNVATDGYLYLPTCSTGANQTAQFTVTYLVTYP